MSKGNKASKKKKNEEDDVTVWFGCIPVLVFLT